MCYDFMTLRLYDKWQMINVLRLYDFTTLRLYDKWQMTNDKCVALYDFTTLRLYDFTINGKW